MTVREKLPYSKDVENHIKKCIDGGVGTKDMLMSMQHLQAAPGALSTLYKIYGPFIAKCKADLNGSVGRKVIQQALDGDFKSQELFLRSKAGWSPTQTVETTEAVDEDLDDTAIKTLMDLLGKSEE